MTQALHCDSQYHSFWTHRQPGCRCSPTPFVLLSANTADQSATRRSNCRRQRRALHRLSAFNSKHEGPTESQKAPGLLDKISDQRGSGQVCRASKVCLAVVKCRDWRSTLPFSRRRSSMVALTPLPPAPVGTPAGSSTLPNPMAVSSFVCRGWHHWLFDLGRRAD